MEIAALDEFFFDQTASTPWGPALIALAGPERRGLVASIRARLEPFRNESGVHRVPFRSHLLTAR